MEILAKIVKGKKSSTSEDIWEGSECAFGCSGNQISSTIKKYDRYTAYKKNDILMQGRWLIYIVYLLNSLNPFSANPTKWSNLNNLSALADELFKCVWPFCGVGS